MYKKKKSYYILIIILLLASITFGYAIINSTLTINGKSNISKNTWDVYFDNVVVRDGSVEAVKIPTVTDKTTVDFEVALNLPGDYYEFTVDVVNDGSIDVMIESITKEPELTKTQQKYLNYTIAYENNEQITTKQLVKKEEFVRLKVKVELRKDIDPSDLPEVGDVLYLSFTVNYVQSDSNGVSVKDNGVSNSGVKPVANGSLDEIGTIVTIGDQQFYTIGTEGDNVKLLSMYNLYVGSECTSSSGLCTSYGEEATGKQDSTMLGFIDEQNVWKGTTVFSSSSQKGTKYSDYNGSIVERYVNEYKGILEGEEYGIDVVEARLITKDELESEDIGCDSSNYTCSDAPSLIYSTSYWSGSAYGSYDVWLVYSSGSLGNFSYSNAKVGVRPVIVIPKSEIVEQQIIEFTVDGVSYQAEEGMTWREWINSEYNLDGYYESNSAALIIINGSPYAIYKSEGPIDIDVNLDETIEKNVNYPLWDY